MTLEEIEFSFGYPKQTKRRISDMNNKNLLFEQFNEQHPRNAEVHVVTLPIASRRERRQQAKKNGIAFEPQYNYLAPLTIAEKKERTNKLMQWLKKTKKQIANA